MTKNYLEVKSNLAKAKNLGSSNSGSHHWLNQRLTALALLPLFGWLVYFTFTQKSMQAANIVEDLCKLHNMIPALLTASVGLYHSILGMQVVIEDYIHSIMLKNSLIILLKLVTMLTIFVLLIVGVYFIKANFSL